MACLKEERNSSSSELNSLPVEFVEQQLSAITGVIFGKHFEKDLTFYYLGTIGGRGGEEFFEKFFS